MAYSGRFIPIHPEKYTGDVSKIFFRSLWERSVMVRLDTWSVVLKWCSEEIRIPYRSPLDNRIHQYYPDFEVLLKTPSGNKKAILEVKPYKQTIEPKKPKKISKRYIGEVMEYGKNQAKWASARAWCENKGMEFIVLTEKEVFGQKV